MIILLTGAGGQLGADLKDALRDHQLHAFDHRGLDITDAGTVAATVERFRPNWVINAAAFNDVDGAESAAEQAFAVNAAGPGHLAAAAARAGGAILHVSTDYVFDGRKGSAYTEADQPNPLSVYARSKYEGERRVLSSGADACVIRTAWLYGLHGRNFVTAILAAAQTGGPLNVVADQVGSPTATQDLGAAIAGLIETPARGLFHVVNSGACSRFEFARAIVAGLPVEVRPITTAQAGRVAARPAYSALTSTRWASTGLPPLPPWQDALGRFLRQKQAAPH